jgi:DNA-directed RNA polymerase specialized sigma24 family protein
VCRLARTGGISEAPADLSQRDVDLVSRDDGGRRRDELIDSVAIAVGKLDTLHQMIVLRRTGMDGLEPWSLMECADAFHISFASVKRFYAEAKARIATELFSQGWNPALWQSAVNEKNHIKVS